MSFWQITPFLFEKVVPLIKSESELSEYFIKNFKIKLENLSISAELMSEAFTHKSFAHEVELMSKNNEKLEFIGDAALDTVVSSIIYHKYPSMSEGELSKLRSAIVNEKSLARISRILGLGHYIILGRGEYKLKGFEKDSILANTFEAMLGAVFIEQGLDSVFKLIEEIYHLCLKQGFDFLNEDLLIEFDAKTKLQEIVMQKFQTLPEYNVVEIKEGKKIIFEVNCLVNDIKLASIKSQSKKKAMQEVAAKILKENIIENHMENLC